MDYYELIILAALLLDPDGYHVKADGKVLYVLGNDDKLVAITGADFDAMDDDQLKLWLINHFKK